MEVRVHQRAAYSAGDVHVKHLDLFAQGDDDEEALDALKDLFESKDSDLVLTIRVTDGLVSVCDVEGLRRG